MGEIKQLMTGIDDSIEKLDDTNVAERKLHILDVLRDEVDFCLKEMQISQQTMSDAGAIDEFEKFEIASAHLEERVHYLYSLQYAIAALLK